MTERAQVTAEALDKALAHVLAAPKDGAAVEMLCLRPAYNLRRFVDRITVTREHGIPGERWSTAPWLRRADGSPDPGIQISILPRRVLDLVWRDRETTPHPGDTFIADLDMSEANLPAGSLLAVGTAVLRVSEVFNDACVKWKVRYGDAAKAWIVAEGHKPLRLRGILCSVEHDGAIANGDRITRLG